MEMFTSEVSVDLQISNLNEVSHGWQTNFTLNIECSDIFCQRVHETVDVRAEA